MTYGLEPADDRESRESTRPILSPQAALEDLRRQLVRYAVKLVWNRADAEEIVQDTFKIAAEKQIAVGDETLRPWLFRTTGHLCLNHRRRRKPESLTDWIAPTADQSPLARASDAERIERLRTGIAELPGQQRIAVTLRCIEQFGYADVAAIMNISESAARAHVHQGRRRLAEAMRSDDDA